jgi:hypothetical protein
MWKCAAAAACRPPAPRSSPRRPRGQEGLNSVGLWLVCGRLTSHRALKLPTRAITKMGRGQTNTNLLHEAAQHGSRTQQYRSWPAAPTASKGCWLPALSSYVHRHSLWVNSSPTLIAVKGRDYPCGGLAPRPQRGHCCWFPAVHQRQLARRGAGVEWGLRLRQAPLQRAAGRYPGGRPGLRRAPCKRGRMAVGVGWLWLHVAGVIGGL